MLKIPRNTKSTRLGKSKVEIGDNSKNEFINIMVNDNEIDKNEFGNSEIGKKKIIKIYLGPKNRQNLKIFQTFLHPGLD